MNGVRSKQRNRWWTAGLIVSIAVFVVCLGALGVIGYGYWHGTQTYETIAEQAFPEKEVNALASMTVDWDVLTDQNPDTVGWVYMPGTSIDYPIVQGETDEEYLKKDFSGNAGGLVHKGAIFLSSDNASDMSDQGNYLYGHNMNDETMFAHLLAMTDQSVFDEARTFYILTPTMNYRCMTYALDVVESTETSILQRSFASQDALAAYVEERKAASVVEVPADVDATSANKLFTLITCGDDYAATRAVLCAAVVEKSVPTNATSAATDASA